MTKLLLIRHGITKQNMKGLFLGRTDVALDKIGIRQAIALSNQVHKEFSIDVIFTSPLKRAYDTAKKIKGSRNIPLVQSELLVEMEGERNKIIRMNNIGHLNHTINPATYYYPELKINAQAV